MSLLVLEEHEGKPQRYINHNERGAIQSDDSKRCATLFAGLFSFQ